MEKTYLEPTSGSDRGSESLGMWEQGAWSASLVWLVLSRFWYMPEVLFEWDSANYVLGTRQFDVFDHQPHPPGNPLFVLMLWLVGPSGVGPLQFLVVNAVLGAGVLGLLGWMARPLIGPVGAFLVALCFAFCPPFWFQGAVTTAYVAECFTVTVAGAVALGMARGTLSLPRAAFIAALALGLRPSALPAVGPVLAFGIWLSRPQLRPLLASGVVFTLTCLAWTIPIFASAGGVGPYREASAALWDWQVELGSVLGDGRIVWKNTTILTRYLVDGLNILGLGGLFNGVVILVRRRLAPRSALFLALWTLPGALVYALHHLAKSAYVLTLMPASFLGLGLLAGLALHELVGWRRRVVLGMNGAILILYLGLNALAFQVAIPSALLTYRDAPVELPDPMIMTGDYGRLALAYRTWPQRHTQRLLDALDDDRDLAVFLFGTHELMRLQMASSPAQWTVATSVDHGAAFDTRGELADLSFGAYQNQVLRAPELGLSMEQATTLEHVDGALRLTRFGRDLTLEKGRSPERILVFAQCPPCTVTVGEGFSEVGRVRVSAAVVAIELRSNWD